MRRPGRLRRIGQTLLNVLLASAALLASGVAADSLLGWLGYPAHRSVQIGHPPHFEERRKALEFSYSFETNGRGLRDAEIPAAKPPAERRVLVVGDSYVEGVGVESGDTFVARLEAAFARPGQATRFINAGLAGTGPAQYGRAAVRFASVYRVDAVLICVFANDPSNTSPEAFASDAIVPRAPSRTYLRWAAYETWPHLYTAVARALALASRGRGQKRGFVATVEAEARARGLSPREIRAWRSRLPPRLVAAVERGEFNGGALADGLLRPGYWVDAIDVETEAAHRRWRAMERVLSGIAKTLRADGRGVALIYIPARYQVDASSHSPSEPSIASGVRVSRRWLTATTEAQHRMRVLAESLAVAYLDTTSPLRRAVSGGRRLYWELDGHLTARGNSELAGIIAAWIRRERALGPAFHGDDAG